MINEGLKKYLQNSKVINLAVLDSVVDREIEKATEDIEVGGFDEDSANFIAEQLEGNYNAKLKLNEKNLKNFDFSADHNNTLQARTGLYNYIDYSEIKIPKEVEKIGKNCFYMDSTPGFGKVVFESLENLKEIGENAFCSNNVTNVVIENKNGTIEKIGSNAFMMPSPGDAGMDGTTKDELYNLYLKDLVENSEMINCYSFGPKQNYYTKVDSSNTYETLGDVFFFRSGSHADEYGNGPWNNYKKICISSASSGIDSSNKILNFNNEVEIIGEGFDNYRPTIKLSNSYNITINFGDSVRKIGQYSIGQFYGSFTINIGSGIEKIEKGAIILDSAGNNAERTINIKAKSSDFPNYQEWFYCLNGASSSNIQVNFLED